ncbi:MAG: response regulator [Anaerolineae bacterium]
MKILYVEDNPANVFLVKRVARMGSHEIINYIDGNQALRKFDEINPDLVLMDIQLAGDKSGLDVVRELRSRGVQTPIIAVTAYAMVGDRERCIEAGCDDYLAKPLPIPRLVEIFQSYQEQVTQSMPAQTTVEVSAVPERSSKTEPISEDAPVTPADDDAQPVSEDTPVTPVDDDAQPVSEDTPVTPVDDDAQPVSEDVPITPVDDDAQPVSEDAPVTSAGDKTQPVSEDAESVDQADSNSQNHDMMTVETGETIEEAKTGE